MRVRWLALLSLLPLVLSACSEQGNSPVVPASDKLTFLFFFTEG